MRSTNRGHLKAFELTCKHRTQIQNVSMCPNVCLLDSSSKDTGCCFLCTKRANKIFWAAWRSSSRFY